MMPIWRPNLSEMCRGIRLLAAVSVCIFWSGDGLGQTIETPNVSPAAIEVGTGKQVIVNVQIIPSNHSVLANGVNLLQIDQNGNNANIIGSLNDAGVNGDAIAGDGIYSGTVILSPAAAGQISFRVSVALSGLLRRILSPPVAVQIMSPGLPTRPRAINPTLTVTDTITGNSVICNELLVTFHPGVTGDAAAGLIASHGGSLIGVLAALGVYQVGLSTCDSNSLSQARADFVADSLVASVDFDGVSSLSQVSSSPNDPFFIEGAQWGLEKIDMRLGWSVAQNAGVLRSARIGVVDSGVSTNHEDLFAHVVSGYNWCPALDHNQCTGGNANTLDDYGHGTAVSGLAASVSNNAKGVASPAYNALIVAEKVNAPGTDSLSATSMANGIYDAVYQGARVINVSAGSSAYCSQALLNAITYAAERDVTIVASAGNFGNHVRQCPAAYSSTNSNVIAVAASDKNDGRSIWRKADGSFCNPSEPGSNYGSWVNLYAPGSEIFLLQYNHNVGPLAYEYGFGQDAGMEPTCSSGTSYAAPLVTGTIALMLSVNKSLSPNNIRTLLSCSADSIGDDPDGNVMDRLNAGQALKLISAGNTSCTVDIPKTVSIDFEHFPDSRGNLTIPTPTNCPNWLCNASLSPYTTLGVQIAQGQGPGGETLFYNDSCSVPFFCRNHYLSAGQFSATFSVPVFSVSIDSDSFWPTTLTAYDANNNILGTKFVNNTNPGIEAVLATLSFSSAQPIARVTVADSNNPGRIFNVDNLSYNTTH